jgi:hypothetical protein
LGIYFFVIFVRNMSSGSS